MAFDGVDHLDTTWVYPYHYAAGAPMAFGAGEVLRIAYMFNRHHGKLIGSQNLGINENDLNSMLYENYMGWTTAPTVSDQIWSYHHTILHDTTTHVVGYFKAFVFPISTVGQTAQWAECQVNLEDSTDTAVGTTQRFDVEFSADDASKPVEVELKARRGIFGQTTGGYDKIITGNRGSYKPITGFVETAVGDVSATASTPTNLCLATIEGHGETSGGDPVRIVPYFTIMWQETRG